MQPWHTAGACQCWACDWLLLQGGALRPAGRSVTLGSISSPAAERPGPVLSCPSQAGLGAICSDSAVRAQAGLRGHRRPSVFPGHGTSPLARAVTCSRPREAQCLTFPSQRHFPFCHVFGQA